MVKELGTGNLLARDYPNDEVVGLRDGDAGFGMRDVAWPGQKEVAGRCKQAYRSMTESSGRCSVLS